MRATQIQEILPGQLQPGIPFAQLVQGVGLNLSHGVREKPADLGFIPAPHADNLPLRKTMDVNQAQHEEGFGGAASEGGLEGILNQVHQTVVRLLLVPGRDSLKETGLVWLIIRSDIRLAGAPAFAVNPSIGCDRGQPALERAFAVVFFQERGLAIWAADTVSPHIRE